jgi:hypothetical protein
MNSLLILSAAFCLTLPAYAILGETREQCTARYGKPIETSVNSMTFLHGGYQIIVRYAEKKAVIISYTKEKEEDAAGNRIFISDAEVMTLLKSNGGKQEWKAIERELPEDAWHSADKKFYAEHLFTGALWVRTAEYASSLLTGEE